MAPTGKKYCRNCFHPLEPRAKFCSECGQRDTDGKVTMLSLMQRFWNNLFHLESKFLRMVWHLLNPGYVTKEYFSGKHKRYPHPVQFFFVIMFFALLIVNLRTSDNRGINLVGDNLTQENIGKLRGELEVVSAIRKNIDSLPKSLNNTETRLAIDSLLTFTSEKYGLNVLEKDSIGVLTWDDGKGISFALSDIVRMTPDSLVEYYQINNYFLKLLSKQLLKTAHDGKGMAKFYIASSTWAILVIIALMAAWLHITHQSKRYRYVEHFVLMLHLMCGIIFLATIVVVVRQYLNMKFIPAWPLILYVNFAPLLAFKRYYGQSWLRTTLKWMVFMFIQTFCLIFVFLLGFGVCLLIF